MIDGIFQLVFILPAITVMSFGVSFVIIVSLAFCCGLSPPAFPHAFMAHVVDETGDRHTIYFDCNDKEDELRARVFHGVDSYNDLWLCASVPSTDESNASLLFQHWGINANQSIACHYNTTILQSGSCLDAFLDKCDFDCCVLMLLFT